MRQLFKHHPGAFAHLAAVLALLPTWASAQTTPTEPSPPLKLVALQPDDDFARRLHSCSSQVFTESGEPLAKLDGTSLLARLNTPVFAGEGKPDSPLIELVALEKSRSFGQYKFTFNGSSGLHANRKIRQQLYIINANFSNKKSCAAKEGGLCNTYSGTMNFGSGLMGDIGYPNQNPPVNVTLRDECEKGRDQEGLFVFTGFLDRLGATIFMGGSR